MFIALTGEYEQIIKEFLESEDCSNPIASSMIIGEYNPHNFYKNHLSIIRYPLDFENERKRFEKSELAEVGYQYRFIFEDTIKDNPNLNYQQIKHYWFDLEPCCSEQAINLWAKITRYVISKIALEFSNYCIKKSLYHV